MQTQDVLEDLLREARHHASEAARLRIENAMLRRQLSETRAERVWQAVVNGAVGTMLGVAVAMSMCR